MPDTSFTVWSLVESIEWKHLPDEGGLMDQDEQLLLDLGTISFISQIVEQDIKNSKAAS